MSESNDWYYFALDDEVDLSDTSDLIFWLQFFCGAKTECESAGDIGGENWGITHISTTGISYYSLAIKRRSDAYQFKYEFGYEFDD